MMTLQLSTADHDSSGAGLTYVYPVVSRRAGGLSIGINFNTNNNCNWRCIYCQVPQLQLGAAPPLDFKLLEYELRNFLEDVIKGAFYDRFKIGSVEPHIKDIAIAGNGEPTTLKQFPEAVELIGKIGSELGVFPVSRYILITNGSLIHHVRIQDGLRCLKRYGGEVWFKVDSATPDGKRLLNNTTLSNAAVLANLQQSAKLCSTSIQTCLVDYRNQGFQLAEKQALLAFLANVKHKTAVDTVMLYTLARPSQQAEAVELQAMNPEILQAFAKELQEMGFKVSVNS
jgi:wyosine [tRNA(Phe)-imidazoG37] synthetase (radical SAM superfamily)